MNIEELTSTPGDPAPEPQDKPAKSFYLRPEEVKMYKECSRGLYLKIGVPFAAVIEVVAKVFFKPPAPDESFSRIAFKRGFRFFGNVIIGGFFATPICYYKLVAMRVEFLKRTGNLKDSETAKIDWTVPVPQPVTQGQDFNYPINEVSDLSEPETNFPSDMDTPKFIPDDLDVKKTSKTTYQELRARHRSNLRGPEEPSLHFVKDVPEPGIYSNLPEKPIVDNPQPPLSPKRVRKNKYGDEIE